MTIAPRPTPDEFRQFLDLIRDPDKIAKVFADFEAAEASAKERERVANLAEADANAKIAEITTAADEFARKAVEDRAAIEAERERMLADMDGERKRLAAREHDVDEREKALAAREDAVAAAEARVAEKAEKAAAALAALR